MAGRWNNEKDWTRLAVRADDVAVPVVDTAQVHIGAIYEDMLQ